MKCYQPHFNPESRQGVRFFWSRSKLEEDAYTAKTPPSEISPWKATSFEHGGVYSVGALVKPSRLTQASITSFQNAHPLIKSDYDGPFDVLGNYSILLAEFPLMSDRLKVTLEENCIGVFEFTQVRTPWNVTTGKLVSGGPFWHANLLARHDAWDHDKTVFSIHQTPNGGSVNLLKKSTSTVLASRLGGKTIWRDPVSSEVLCGQVLKDIFESLGIDGWDFSPIKVTVDYH